jgi:pyruvate dehydrogenase E1 component alpha subunit
MDAHTNADDATRYRDAEEVRQWEAADPLARLETYLTARGLLTADGVETARAEAEEFAADLRERMNTDTEADCLELFDHVFAEPTPQLLEQREALAAEILAQKEN